MGQIQRVQFKMIQTRRTDVYLTYTRDDLTLYSFYKRTAILHGCARTTAAVRPAIQKSGESTLRLSERYAINPKTVSKWRKRDAVEDGPGGPKNPRSTVLSGRRGGVCGVSQAQPCFL